MIYYGRSATIGEIILGYHIELDMNSNYENCSICAIRSSLCGGDINCGRNFKQVQKDKYRNKNLIINRLFNFTKDLTRK